MKTKRDVGTTTYNDGLLLPSGMLSIDNERKALRFHDGKTVGGYEILGVPIRPDLVPGENVTAGGNLTAGFFGEVLASDFISGNELVEVVGMSEGSGIHSDSGWLKFALDGKILFISKRPIRRSVSWDGLNNSGLIFSERTVTVRGFNYVLRLPRTAVIDPSGLPLGNNWDHSSTHGSEWNRLMYRIQDNGFYDNRNTVTSEPMARWTTYSEEELALDSRVNVASGNWCQETTSLGLDTPLRAAIRGRLGVSHVSSSLKDGTISNWRPVLELVS